MHPAAATSAGTHEMIDRVTCVRDEMFQMAQELMRLGGTGELAGAYVSIQSAANALGRAESMLRRSGACGARHR